ncbi:ISAzo13 family transposase [Streptomyces sp. NPDC048258]|uniref:ISAzo13 family transposase n=1 Tax=Streptomyces sp. NPDC048258 TaxID=3365527 RepID=UPI00371D651E
MKHYPAEFKADAVALYRSRPGATIKSVAADLGVNTETLRNWIRAADGRRPDTPIAIPYGIYDLGRDSGWVNVGTDRNTAAFAVESLRRWWTVQGCLDYPGVDRLLVTADSGGANSADSRLFKMGLAGLADEYGLIITVMHFPPGTSKWNKVEHRLFSRITHSLRGQPLTSYEVLLETISATRTSTGLTVAAALDENAYPTGRVLSRAERTSADRRVRRDDFHGEWNYTIVPQATDQHLSEGLYDESGPPVPAEATLLLTHPALTGLTRERFDELALKLEPCRQVLAEAQRQREGRDRRGRNPGFGILDHRHRILVALLRSRNTVTLTLMGKILGYDRNTLSYHATTSRPLLAFAGTDLTPALTPRTHPPRTLEALQHVIEHHDNNINSRSS